LTCAERFFEAARSGSIVPGWWLGIAASLCPGALWQSAPVFATHVAKGPEEHETESTYDMPQGMHGEEGRHDLMIARRGEQHANEVDRAVGQKDRSSRGWDVGTPSREQAHYAETEGDQTALSGVEAAPVAQRDER
jgi:hypothetical protein